MELAMRLPHLPLRQNTLQQTRLTSAVTLCLLPLSALAFM